MFHFSGVYLFIVLLIMISLKGHHYDLVSVDATASKALGVDAFVLFKNKAYLIFFIAAILVCIPLSFYFGFGEK